MLCGVTMTGVAGHTAALVAAGVPLPSREALEHTWPIVPLAVLVGAVVGALVVGRHPHHRVGWLFCVGQAGASLGLAAQALERAVLTGTVPASTRVGQLTGWIGHLFGAGYALTLLGLLLVLAPHGRLPSRRWWPVPSMLVGGYGVMVAGLLLVPPSRFGPEGPVGAGAFATALMTAGQVTITIGLAGAALALTVRLRRTRGDEHQQLRWIATAAAALAAALVVMVLTALVRGVDRPTPWSLQVLFYLGYLAVPVATGFAVLHHRLYDIDLILDRTVRLAVLAVFVTAGHVGAVVALGSLLAGASGAVWSSLVAYVLVALAFQPLRERVDRFADRVVYGRRSAPYDSLARIGREVAASGMSEGELLRLVARCGAQAVGARAARATVSVPDGTDLTEHWPRPPAAVAGLVVPVSHRDEVLGSIDLELQPGHALTAEQRRLLGELAASAALAFHNVRLSAALRTRAEALECQGAELSASRRRLLTAADTERERVATTIRREVAAHLDPLPAALAGLRERVRDDPAGARRALEGMQQATVRAIEALRSITAGVVPPLLARRGLAAAVQAHAGRSPTRAGVVVAPDVAGRRLDPPTEAAAYQCCVYAIDALAGARVRIDVAGGRLVVSASGRAGSLPDQQHLRDRVEAVGGQLAVDYADGDVELLAVLPWEPWDDHATASASGPKPALSR